MNDMTLYYDYIDNMKCPVWLVIKNIDWTRSIVYLPINYEFKKEEMDYFEDIELSVSVFIGDLLLNESMDNYFGVNIKRILERIHADGFDPSFIKQFVIRVVDLKEVIYSNRAISFC